MRNRATILISALVALAFAAAPAMGASGPGAIDSRAGVIDSATLTACTTGASAGDRSAHFTATMLALPRTRSMAISFDLFERAPHGTFTQVPAPGFGVWQTSNPGITTFTANENVLDLPAPAAFRAVVHYRWLNARHQLIRIDKGVSSPCVELLAPVPAPDLFIALITHAPGSPPATTEDYSVTVRNGGAGAAGAFAVALDIGGTALPQQTVSTLAAGAAVTVQFTGPRCSAGSQLTATADPSGSISEPANARRTVSIQCRS
jgi:hypothetical protein